MGHQTGPMDPKSHQSGDPAQPKAQIFIRLGLDQSLVLIRSVPDQSPVLIGSATGHSLAAEAQYPSDQTWASPEQSSWKSAAKEPKAKEDKEQGPETKQQSYTPFCTSLHVALDRKP